MNGKLPGKPAAGGEQSIGSLFDSPNKSGLFKKLFSRRHKGSSKSNVSCVLHQIFSLVIFEISIFLQLTPEHSVSANVSPSHSSSGRVSPGPQPGMLRQVLLGNRDPFAGEEEEVRVRLSSMSGKPVLQKGMGLVIGDMSSSESESEEEEEEEEDDESRRDSNG